jgi:hypothetical protein
MIQAKKRMNQEGTKVLWERVSTGRKTIMVSAGRPEHECE